MVRDHFLATFHSRQWTVLEVGRLARLELGGPRGSLHIYAVYLDPGDPSAQAASIKRLAAAQDPKVHNLVCGYFNFVMCAHDRISKYDASCSGDSGRDKS